MKKNMIRLLGAFCAVSSLVLATGCIEETLPKTEATPETIEKSTSSMEYMLNGKKDMAITIKRMIEAEEEKQQQ